MARGRPSKKQLILDTALDLFSKAGFQGTSIDLVVQKAGVSKPTVYNNFPTKQALLSELIGHLLIRAQTDRDSLLDEQETSTSALLVSAFQQIATDPAYLALYRIFYGEQYKLDEKTQIQLAKFDQDVNVWVSKLVKQRYPQWDDVAIFMLFAACRELMLTPIMLGQRTGQDASLRQKVQCYIEILEQQFNR